MTSAKSTQTQPSLRVLAFDPGFERLGIAVLEKHLGKDVLLYSACMHTPKTLSFPQRLLMLGKEVERLIQEWSPSHLALEDVFFEKNAKTAIQVAQVRGLLAYEGARHHLVVCSYTPLQVKIAVTGYGKSDKRAVAAMVPRLVILPSRKRLDDEIDAIAVGLTCLACERYPHTGGSRVAK